MESNYWAHARAGRLSRRSLIRGGGVAAAGLAGAALIGCGSGDEDSPATVATTAAPTAAAGGGSATATATAVAANQPKAGGIFNRSASGDPANLDPYKSGAVAVKTLAAHIYSRLYRVGVEENGDPYDAPLVPDAAESAESTDGQHWTVKIKNGIKFHDIAPVSGREMTAEDVVFSYQRLVSDTSPNNSQFKFMTGMQAVDDHTLSMTLDAPSPEFFDKLTDANLLFIQPKEADGGFDPSQQPIGTGPWILKEYVPSTHTTYVKHPDYFVPGVPYMDGIEEPIIPETANMLAQFEAGNLDIGLVPADQLLDYKNRHPEFSWQPGTGNGMSWIAFSGKEASPDALWRDPRFRQGVSMAVDRDGLLNLAANSKTLLEAGFDSPILTRWNNIPEPCAFGPKYWLDPKAPGMGAEAAYFHHNPAEAKKMFDAIGVGNASIPYQYTTRYSATFVLIAQAAGNMLAEAGLNLAIEEQDYNSKYITHTFLGDFQGLAYGLESTLTPGGYAERLFGVDKANHGQVHEPEMEELVTAQGRELDIEARTEIFYEMARRNAKGMYYSPAQSTSTTQWTGFSGRVHGTRRTQGYGSGTEVYAYLWLDA